MSAEWYCQISDTEYGPMSTADLRAMAANGRLQPSDAVRKCEDGKWRQAGSIRGLFSDSVTVDPVQNSSKMLPPADDIDTMGIAKIEAHMSELNRQILSGFLPSLMGFALLGLILGGVWGVRLDHQLNPPDVSFVPVGCFVGAFLSLLSWAVCWSVYVRIRHGDVIRERRRYQPRYAMLKKEKEIREEAARAEKERHLHEWHKKWVVAKNENAIAELRSSGSGRFMIAFEWSTMGSPIVPTDVCGRCGEARQIAKRVKVELLYTNLGNVSVNVPVCESCKPHVDFKGGQIVEPSNHKFKGKLILGNLHKNFVLAYLKMHPGATDLDFGPMLVDESMIGP